MTLPISSSPSSSPTGGKNSTPTSRQRGGLLESCTFSWWFVAGTVLGFFFWGESPFQSSLSYTGSSSTVLKTLGASGSASNINPVVHSDTILLEETTTEEIPVLWVRPHHQTEITGLLFVAHGCSHSHSDWFVNCGGDDTTTCLGLPEERAIVQTALDLGLAVVAISSKDRTSKCWSLEEDLPRVQRVVEEYAHRLSSACLTNLPIYAFGASSGGAFVSQAAPELGALGFVSQIAAVPPPPTTKHTPPATPCQVYLTMSKDAEMDQAAAEIVQDSSKNPAVQAHHISLDPIPIDPLFFASKIPSITLAQSQELVEALHHAKLLDEETNLLLEDPRKSPWRKALAKHVHALEVPDTLEADASAISEVLNVAYARHELSREGVQQALEFCLHDPQESEEEKLQTTMAQDKAAQAKKRHKKKVHAKKYYKQDWKEWPQEVVEAAEYLGYDEDSWNNDETPTDIDKIWKKLTKGQQVAAGKLGYTATTWDGEDEEEGE